MMPRDIECCRPCSEAIGERSVARSSGSLPRDLVDTVRQYHPDPRTGACCHVRNIKTIPIFRKLTGGMALCILLVAIDINDCTLFRTYCFRWQSVRTVSDLVVSLLQLAAIIEFCSSEAEGRRVQRQQRCHTPPIIISQSRRSWSTPPIRSTGPSSPWGRINA